MSKKYLISGYFPTNKIIVLPYPVILRGIPNINSCIMLINALHIYTRARIIRIYRRMYICRLLPSINVLSLHGKMKSKRYKVFDKFRIAENGILICTDVMARGIDISEIDWVLQYDPPSTASSFVHR